FAMRSCRRSAWSTIIPSIVSGMLKLRGFPDCRVRSAYHFASIPELPSLKKVRDAYPTTEDEKEDSVFVDRSHGLQWEPILRALSPVCIPTQSCSHPWHPDSC